MTKFLLNRSFVKKIFFAVMTMAFFTINAQLKKDFSPRYSETINGDFTMIANNVLSRHATDSYTGQESNHNFSDNVFVDIDSDPTTFNSSSANLSNPAMGNSCLTIRKVFLYWAAADKEYEIDNSGNIISGTGGSEPSWNFNEVKLMLPGSNDYGSTITADEVIYRGRDEHFDNDPYICFKDITDQVQALNDPFGKYQIANVKATEGILRSHVSNTGTSGGWQIVFVYQSPTLVQKNITLFDGYAHISIAENNFDVTFDGFQTVPNGSVNASMVMGSLEGDRGLMQDRLLLNDTNSDWVPLSTNLRNEDNFFNSSITVNGSHFLDRSPASTNTLGYDAGLFRLDNTNNQLITNNQTSAIVRMTSNQETYGLYLLGLSVEVWQPLLNTLDLYSSASTENVGAGDSFMVYLDVANTGNDNIRNLTFTTTIPEELDFINTESLPDEITYTFNDQTRELIFSVSDGFTDVSDAPYTIRYNLRVKDESYFSMDNTTCSFNSEQQTIANFSGEINQTANTANSSFTFDECGVGNGDPTLIAVNIIDTIAPVFVEELPADMVVECDQVPAAVILTAIDNCDADPVVTFEETATNDSDCTIGYEITRTWEAMDESGNSVTHTQIITVNRDTRCDIENIIISKTITANGDGVNDLFEITNLEGCGYSYHVKIFNRWGALVYESNDYNNDWGGYAPGNSLGGSGMLPSGTYYYIIGFNTTELRPINGYIYIGTN